LTNTRKLQHPPKAYWNKLDPGEIPDCIKVLSRVETGLLSRIHAYVKVIKFDGTFGQYGFKGLSTVFAKDIFEVTDKVNVLPRASNDANIIIVTEVLENLDKTYEYKIDRSRLLTALRWLVANNPLYKDVIIDEEVHLDENDIVRTIQPPQNEQIQAVPVEKSHYVPIKGREWSRILRASFHQGSDEFESGFEGIQCCAMALAVVVRAKLIPPALWNTNILNQNLLAGDDFYASLRALENEDAFENNPIPPDGFLKVNHFDIFKNDFLMYGCNGIQR
jgi:hypothetical protein